MKSPVRLLVRFLAVGILITCLVPAFFFTQHETAQAVEPPTCYKYDCDGIDPINSRCGTTPPSQIRTDKSANIVRNGSIIGIVEVRLSLAAPNGCNTIWTRTTSYIGTAIVWSYIYSYRAGYDNEIELTGTSTYTNQFGRDGNFDVSGCVEVNNWAYCAVFSYS